MKKSLIALAVLGSFVGAASAQSSVTLFGVVDANVRSTSSSGKSLKLLGTDGINSSRLGFRGEEALGDGLKASFWMEHRFQPDSGNLTSSRFWHGRSSVSLSGDFGEVRLGRYTTLTFDGFADFDPFGTNGVGAVNAIYSTLGSQADTLVRSDNTVTYFLPGNLGGFYGGFAVAAGEATVGKKMTAGRVGYAQGPVNVSASFSSTDGQGGKYKLNSFAGSYDLGVAKLLGTYSQTKFVSAKQAIFTLGVTVPVGAGVFKAAYTRADASGNNLKGVSTDADDSNLFVLGYVHNLSKRTALYTTVARYNNKGAAAFGVSGSPTVTPGNASSGYEAGVRHSF